MAEPPVVTVTGTVYNEDHTTLYTGPIYFIRNVPLKHTDGTLLLPMGTPIKYDVVNGAVSVQLLYVDALGWGPVGWSWEVRIMRGSIWKSYALAPSVDDPDTVNLGDLLVTDYVPSAGSDYAPANHTHAGYATDAELAAALETVDGTIAALDATYATDAQLTAGLAGRAPLVHAHAISDVTGLQAALDAKAASAHTHTVSQITDFVAAVAREIRLAERRATGGEFWVRRDDVNTELPLVSGNLYLTHFTGAQTATRMSFRTTTAGTVATSATHSWIGVLLWNGTQYLPHVVSVDDPTRWTDDFLTYNTPIFAADGVTGAANLGDPGFDEVEGQEYAGFMLWTGSGTAPALPAIRVNFGDAMAEPRANAYIGLSAPPSSPLNAEWVAPTDRRFQALMTNA